MFRKSKELKPFKHPRIAPIILLLFATLGVGTVFYRHIENMSWIDSLYFCVMTLTTVGYGDVTPTTDGGKVFTMIYVIFGVAIIAAAANYLLHATLDVRIPHIAKQIKHRTEHPFTSSNDAIAKTSDEPHKTDA